jgi:hypothetical protein
MLAFSKFRRIQDWRPTRVEHFVFDPSKYIIHRKDGEVIVPSSAWGDVWDLDYTIRGIAVCGTNAVVCWVQYDRMPGSLYHALDLRDGSVTEYLDLDPVLRRYGVNTPFTDMIVWGGVGAAVSGQGSDRVQECPVPGAGPEGNGEWAMGDEWQSDRGVYHRA